MPDWAHVHHNIALAVLGASTGVASILLVFVGFMVASATSVPPTLPDSVSAKYMRIAKLGAVLLVANLIVLLTSYWWLFLPGSIVLLKAWSWGFPVVCLLLIPYALWAIFWAD